tara:strand:- start:1611 stop:1889 length:279 start_codon:yes stop_codon:yes gene_type:complete
MVVSLIVGLFASGLMAKEVAFEPAKKPELALKKSDLAVITKAINKKFKGLSSADKKKLIKFLEDYAGSAKHEITPVPVEPSKKGKKAASSKK